MKLKVPEKEEFYCLGIIALMDTVPRVLVNIETEILTLPPVCS